MKTKVLSVNAKYSLKEFLADAPWLNLLLDQLRLDLRDEVQVNGKRQLVAIIEEAAKNCNLLVIVDGSEDFYSKNILSQGFGKALYCNDDAAKTIEDYFFLKGEKPGQEAMSYAQMPQGALPLLNHTGCEQGFALVYASICIAVLPAGKEPLQAIVPDQLYPLILKSMYNQSCTFTVPLKQERVKDVEACLSRRRRAKGFLPVLCEAKEGVVLRMTAIRHTQAESQHCCDRFLQDLIAEQGNISTNMGVGRKNTRYASSTADGKNHRQQNSFYDETLHEEAEDYEYDEDCEEDEDYEGDENRTAAYKSNMNFDMNTEEDGFLDEDLEEPYENNDTQRGANKLAKGRTKNKRSTFDKIRGFLLTICVLIFLGAAGYLGWYYYQSMQNRSNYENLREVYDVPGFAPSSYPAEYDKEFAGLWAINPDIVGWINIDGTALDYPVVQATDNDKYYRQNFEGSYSEHGVPFLDYTVDLKAPSRNTLIYGHNIRTDGQMFNILKEYKDLEYYKQHPIIDFNNVYHKGKYKIFSIFYSSTHPEHGEAFPYHEFINSGSADQTQQFIDEVTMRSVINTGVDVLPTDQLITLSTCSYEFKDARYVVVARKLREGESDKIDTSAAVKNPNPLYPDIWYSLFGGTKPAISPSVNFGGSQAADTKTQSQPDLVQQEKTDTTEPPPADSSAEEPKKEEPKQKEPAEPQPTETDQEGEQKQEKDNAEPDKKDTEKKVIKKKAKEAETIPEEVEVEPQLEEDQPSAEALVQTIDSTLKLQTFGSEAKTVAEKPKKKVVRKRKPKEAQPEVQTEDEAMPAPRAASDLSVKVNGKKKTGSAQEIVSAMVEAEMGTSFQQEALKAQAVAAYSYVRFHNSAGETPQVMYKTPVSKNVSSAVQEVLGVGVYYNGSFANSTYSASNAGMSCSSKDVWGGDLPYLVSVDSPGDKTLKAYGKTEAFSVDTLARNIKSYCKVDAYSYGEPEDWFSEPVYGDGIYVQSMQVCGKTLSGREVREGLMKFEINSSAFDVETNGDEFIFTTYGYGHGVGMSQQGADWFAMEGWNYKEILSHYFPNTEIA